MLRHALLFAAVAAASDLTLAGAAVAAPGLPSRPVPAGLRAVDDGGGRILAGTIGTANDGPAAFRGGLRRADAYFGQTLKLENVVRSNDGNTLMGVFNARLGGVPVMGLAIAGRDAGGQSLVAVLFDEPSRFPHSMGRLVRHLEALPPPAGVHVAGDRGDASDARAAAARIATTTVNAQDGTASARIPQGWQVRRLGEGALVVAGPDNSSVISNVDFSFIDPNNPQGANTLMMQRQTGVSMGTGLTYTDDPASLYVAIGNLLSRMAHMPQATYHVERTRVVASQASGGRVIREVEISGTQEGGGMAPMRYDSLLVYGPPGPTGLWNVTASGMAAPTARYRELMPAMTAIVQGYSYNSGARGRQVEANAQEGRAITARGWASVQAGIAANDRIEAQNQAKVDASMASARATQDGIDRSTAGFVHYLSGTDVVRNTPTGRDAVVSQSASDALTRFDPQHFESVPVSQYVKGQDY